MRCIYIYIYMCIIYIYIYTCIYLYISILIYTYIFCLFLFYRVWIAIAKQQHPTSVFLNVMVEDTPCPSNERRSLQTVQPDMAYLAGHESGRSCLHNARSHVIGSAGSSTSLARLDRACVCALHLPKMHDTVHFVCFPTVRLGGWR